MVRSFIVAFVLAVTASIVLETSAMATPITRPLFTTPDLSLSMTYDDTTLKLQSVHCDDALATEQDVQVVSSKTQTINGQVFNENDVITTVRCLPGHTDFNIPNPQQPTLTLTKGKPDGVYFRTV